MFPEKVIIINVRKNSEKGYDSGVNDNVKFVAKKQKNTVNNRDLFIPIRTIPDK
jgi:hypothetical protein